MKKYTLLILLTGIFLIIGSSRRGQFYQIRSSHPHDVEEFAPFVETAYQNGRLWVVELKDSAPASVRNHLAPLAGGEKSFIYKTSEKKPTSKPIKDHIDDIISLVDKANIKKDVEFLSSFKTRHAGTPENQQAVLALYNRLNDLGYDVEEVCYSSEACSIVAQKKGKTRPEEVVMVMAHIDSVGKEFAGADDNGSGTAVLLEMARVLKDYANNKTIRFFITNGEELGLLGANHYVSKLESENALSELSLVINMDMVGYNSNGIVELETEPEFEDLAKWYAELASKYTALKAKITLGAWGSDHVPFLQQGIPSILTIEDWDTKTPCYHMACDLPDTLNYDYAAEIGKLNISAVLTKDKI
jgi:hypothetical protein